MAAQDDDIFPAGPASEIPLGGDLSRLSEDELKERIRALTGEIARVEAALASRGGVRAAADAMFRKKDD
ncbi:DUF1192 domain-containing protein [Stappia indica]|uniref:DUF1192 domain-containing protein n=1 Tax=Stappia indica TaxID=538381 RepID=UPI001CD64F93|nr:DUF1192 domain-containing protein [Stappia indica]MCA1298244.1 DUF1192 domain-containing protein [Stappia indica]